MSFRRSGSESIAAPQILFYVLLAMALALPISIAATQILAAAGVVVWVWQMLASRERPAVWPPILMPLAACFATTLLSSFVSANPRVSASSLKKFSLFLILYMASQALRSEKQVALVLRVLCLAAAASALLAFVQYPASQPLHRVSGFMGHWQTFSGQLVMLIAVFVGLLLFWGRERWFWAAGAAVCGAALLLSETRGAWLGALAAIALIAFVKDRRLPLAMAVLLPLAYWVLPRQFQLRVQSIYGTQDESSAARLNMWSTGVQMIRAHPWLGVGPNQITALAYQYGGNPRYQPRFFTHLHNDFLQLAAERGIPGLAAWLWLLIRFFWDAAGLVRKSVRQPFAHAVGWGVIGALTALLVAGLFEFNLGDSEVLMLLLLLMGCVYGLAAGVSRREAVY